MSEKQSVAQKRVIEVNIAEMRVARSPDVLVTHGLGSCLGIAIYDPVKKIGGIAHAMLPDINLAKVKSNPCRFVNSTIRKMVEELEKMGGSRKCFMAKLFGGAHMFTFITVDNLLNVGQKNIDTALEVLGELGIKVTGQETGGTFGRTVGFNLEDGKVHVNTISQGEKDI
jgi:chemotaxis protein CheD